MNEKYSKYIESKDGFVVDYSVTPQTNDELIEENNYIRNSTENNRLLLVWTPSTRLSRPYVEDATKERVAYFENRHQYQYQLIFDNKDEIIKRNKRKTRGIIYPLSVILLTLSFILRGLSLPLLFTMGLSFTGVSLIALGEIAIVLVTENFENKLRTYQEYIYNSKKLEERSKKDQNITRYLNEETKELIKEQATLQQDGYIDNIYNTHLMDSMSLKELKELLLRYKMSQALEEPLTFKNSKVKTLKKESPKNNN